MPLYKRQIICILVFITSVITTNCERDDICAETTATTPLLIIKFFDDEVRNEEKNVSNLRVQSTDEESTAFLDLSTTDSIAIPLKTDTFITEYAFTSNSNDENNENSDTLSFQYTTEEAYVSSACGFKVLYRGLTNSGPEGTDENWIKEINIQQSDVLNETVTHVYIYH